MKEVSNLSELVDLVGKETVDKCFTEYMMLMVAKSNGLDKMKDELELYTVGRLKKAQVCLTVEQLQNIIDGNYEER